MTIRLFACAVAALVAVGCSDQGKPKKQPRAAPSVDAPVVQMYETEAGDVSVLYIPTWVDPVNKVGPFFQVCYGWQTPRGQSLHCQSDADQMPFMDVSERPGMGHVRE